MSDASFPEVVGGRIERHRGREFVFSGAALLACVALANIFLHFLGINHYGFFRDELYYIACGRHLAWGYIDQPPLVALLAWISRQLFGDSLAGHRVLPILAGGATIFFTGILAREFGGGRLSQFLAAIAMLFSPLFLAFTSFFSMNAFEPLIWLLCAWLAVRIVKGASAKLWLLFGALAGLGLENKHTMLVFGFALVCGLLLSKQRRAGEGSVFRSKWIWLGALLALAIFLPNLIWEARHGWPQIEVVRNAREFKNVHVSPLQFLAEQVLFMQPVALPIWLAGLYWLLLAGEGKRFRFLGWTFLIVLAIFMTLGGKTYYVLPAYTILAAAGGVAIEQLTAGSRLHWLRFAYPAFLVAGGLVTLPFGVPVLHLDAFARYENAIPYARSVKTERDATAVLPQFYADMIGWDKMAGTIASVYHELPQAEQANCAIFAGNYGEAGAIDYFGPKLGLPGAISGHNNYFLWGPRGYSGECVILFGERAEENKKFFGDVTRVAMISNPLGMPSEQSVPVYICRKPVAPLSVLWPRFRFII
ncbi:MAG: glycosyltransferase family 39 protein [Candidatus Acidiferrales bacterium]